MSTQELKLAWGKRAKDFLVGKKIVDVYYHSEKENEEIFFDDYQTNIRIVFDDGHDTGLYSWEHLYNLCKNYKENWHNYLERLKEAGHSRKKP